MLRAKRVGGRGNPARWVSSSLGKGRRKIWGRT